VRDWHECGWVEAYERERQEALAWTAPADGEGWAQTTSREQQRPGKWKAAMPACQAAGGWSLPVQREAAGRRRLVQVLVDLVIGDRKEEGDE